MSTAIDTARSRVASTGAWLGSSVKTAMIDEAMPADFYDVKLEVTPKAPPRAMWGMAAVAYIPTFVVFCTLLVQGTGVTTKETKITTRDISDDDWTCTMISKVRLSACKAALITRR